MILKKNSGENFGWEIRMRFRVKNLVKTLVKKLRRKIWGAFFLLKVAVVQSSSGPIQPATNLVDLSEIQKPGELANQFGSRLISGELH